MNYEVNYKGESNDVVRFAEMIFSPWRSWLIPCYCWANRYWLTRMIFTSYIARWVWRNKVWTWSNKVGSCFTTTTKNWCAITRRGRRSPRKCLICTCFEPLTRGPRRTAAHSARTALARLIDAFDRLGNWDSRTRDSRIFAGERAPGKDSCALYVTGPTGPRGLRFFYSRFFIPSQSFFSSQNDFCQKIHPNKFHSTK